MKRKYLFISLIEAADLYKRVVLSVDFIPTAPFPSFPSIFRGGIAEFHQIYGSDHPFPDFPHTQNKKVD